MEGKIFKFYILVRNKKEQLYGINPGKMIQIHKKRPDSIEPGLFNFEK